METGLKDKSVIVTGGGSNIGRAIVLGFASEGAHITIGDIDAAQAEKVAAQAMQAGAASASAVRTDVTNFAETRNLVQNAVTRTGTVEVLVNSVGWDCLDYFVKTSPEFWQKVIQINFVGVLNCTKSVLEVMLAHQRGSIVSISSDASRQGEAREAVYGSAKAAVNSFMKTIARENGRFGIRCNAVCPGITLPDSSGDVGQNSMWRDVDAMFSPEQLEKIASGVPLKKLTRPQDVSNAVLFLASENLAGHITGQVLSVSGGYSMVG